MRSFRDHNPVTVAFYYMAAAAIGMFTMDPVLHVLTVMGGFVQFLMQRTGKKIATHLFFWGLGLILALIRPIFNHNGATVLFVVNDNPITKEAFIYGANTAIMVVGVLYLFRVFSIIMTSDRLLYLFGRFSPKTALIMSMGLRYIPLLREKSRQIKAAQTAIGINRDDNAIDRIKAGMNVFSATVSWGLENGIITADSMAARGYGKRKRTCFSAYGMLSSDILLILVTAILMIPTVAALASGRLNTVFYPVFRMEPLSVGAVAGYISYGILMFVPVILDLAVDIRWNILRKR